MPDSLPLFNTTLGYDTSTSGDAVDQIAATPTPGLFDSGGFFSKLVDTTASVYLTKQQIDAAKASKPTAVEANPVTAPTPAVQLPGFNLSQYLPYIGLGVAALIGLAVAVRLTRK